MARSKLFTRNMRSRYYTQGPSSWLPGAQPQQQVAEQGPGWHNAACPRCGGWTRSGGMSQYAGVRAPEVAYGRTGCTCHDRQFQERSQCAHLGDHDCKFGDCEKE